MQTELHGTLDAPLSRGGAAGVFYSITLAEPHQGRTRAILDGEVMGWSKTKKRLGKDELHEGDSVIIRGYRLAQDNVLALEIG